MTELALILCHKFTESQIGQCRLEFASSFQDDARTVSISRLLYDVGSPGQAFKLTESSLSEAIESVFGKTDVEPKTTKVSLALETATFRIRLSTSNT